MKGLSVLAIVFLCFTFSLQALSSPVAEEENNAGETKWKVLKELEKAVGLPNPESEDNGKWMLTAVKFIMEKMNWKFNFTGPKPDPKYVEEATRKIVTAVSWIVGHPRLNPYRSITRAVPSFRSFAKIFKYIKIVEKKENPGGEESAVYLCYKRRWPTCVARAPNTLEGQLVYQFECAWEFYQGCLFTASMPNQVAGASSGPFLDLCKGGILCKPRDDRNLRPKPAGNYTRGCSKAKQCRS